MTKSKHRFLRQWTGQARQDWETLIALFQSLAPMHFTGAGGSHKEVLMDELCDLFEKEVAPIRNLIGRIEGNEQAIQMLGEDDLLNFEDMVHEVASKDSDECLHEFIEGVRPVWSGLQEVYDYLNRFI